MKNRFFQSFSNSNYLIPARHLLALCFGNYVLAKKNQELSLQLQLKRSEYELALEVKSRIYEKKIKRLHKAICLASENLEWYEELIKELQNNDRDLIKFVFELNKSLFESNKEKDRIIKSLETQLQSEREQGNPITTMHTTSPSLSRSVDLNKKRTREENIPSGNKEQESKKNKNSDSTINEKAEFETTILATPDPKLDDRSREGARILCDLKLGG